MKFRLRFMAVIMAMSCFVAFSDAAAAASPPLDWSIPHGHFYTEANGYPLGRSPMGYAIVDDNQASMWTAYQRLGGVARLGYPASQRFVSGGFVTQVTQKAVLQWNPATRTVDLVNVFDLLSQRGLDDWLRNDVGVPRPVSSNFDAGLTWPQVVAHRIDLLKKQPILYHWYESQPDALTLYGLPTSPVVDEGPMYAIRLQRAVLQEWKIAEPWAHAGQVTVVNAGDVAKVSGIYPWLALRPVSPPAGTWSLSPGHYTLFGKATWYGPGFVGRTMADGRIYQPEDPTTTAANAFPLGSVLKVTSPQTKRTITVCVQDTGRFVYPGLLDLSPAAFERLGAKTSVGVLPVSVDLVGFTPLGTTSSTHGPCP